ncbi:MAG: hypothetical protein ACJ78M_13595 [Gemmatimonadaceae bacterium]
MRRPIGVTASAIVAILASMVALLAAAAMVASVFINTGRPLPPNGAQFVIANAAMFLAFAGIGFWTSVGLFRLRSWARISILACAAFLAAGSAFCLLITMVVPIPPEFGADTANTFRRTMATVFGIPLVIAVWWLIQFNTPSTKAAFASPIAGPVSRRPLSITIIAWACIFGGASSVFGILTRAPAFLFGAIFNGWTGGVIYALFGALTLFIGKGLLDLREEARILAIGWFGFSLVHTAIVALVPSLRRRVFEMQRAFAPHQPDPIPFDPGILINVSFALGTILVATAIWFLIRKRDAFGQTENA